MITRRHMSVLAFAVALVAVTFLVRRATAAESAKETERKLIKIIESNAPPQDKAVPCKLLAIYGGKDAVAALAALLPDKDLSSWARIALEANPDSSASDALRYAMDKVEGRLLIGVINSIGYRRDPNAIDSLASKLKDADPEIGSAAAAALGKIGGDRAMAALQPLLGTAPAAVKPAVAEGCIVCAEGFIASGNRDAATKLYDAVRKSDVPTRRVAEATRGAILVRGSEGIGLLVEQLRSTDKTMFQMALRIARELPGGDVTDAIVAELAKASPQRQALLVLVLADRGDAKALPAVLQAARSGPSNVRIAAASVLERLGDVTCVPVLLEAAAGDDAELAKVAKVSLARMSGKDVDAALFARLEQSSGKARQVLIELAEQRRIDGSLAAFVKYAEDSDAGVREAALVAIGAIGDEKQIADLAKLAGKSQDRAGIERAMMSICGRNGAACIPQLMPLMRSGDAAVRVVGLHAMASVGGADALAAIKAALDDKDQTVQNEAVRMLERWPNRWPDDATAGDMLLELAKSGKTDQQKLLALRGYLQYLAGARKLNPNDKYAKVKAALPLVSRQQEGRMVISVLNGIATAGSLETLTALTSDTSVKEEACLAIVNLAGKNIQGATKEQRQKALEAVIEKSGNAATRENAQGLLKRVR